MTRKEAILMGALYDAGISFDEIVDKYPQFSPEDIEYAIFGDETEDDYEDEYEDLDEDYADSAIYSEGGDSSLDEEGYVPMVYDPAKEYITGQLYAAEYYDEVVEPEENDGEYVDEAEYDDAYDDACVDEEQGPVASESAEDDTEDIEALNKLWNSREVEIGGRYFYRIISRRDLKKGGCQIQLPKEAVDFVRRYCHDENEKRHFVASKYEVTWDSSVPEWFKDTVILKIRDTKAEDLGEWLCCMDDLKTELLTEFKLLYNDGNKSFGCQLKDDKDGGRSLCYVVGDKLGKNIIGAIGRLSKCVMDCGVTGWKEKYRSEENKTGSYWQIHVKIGDVEYNSDGKGAYPEGLAKLIWALDKDWKIPIGVE